MSGVTTGISKILGSAGSRLVHLGCVGARHAAPLRTLLCMVALLVMIYRFPAAMQGQAESPVTAIWESDPPPDDGWTVGDRIPLRLQIVNSTDTTIIANWPALPTMWDTFEVRSQNAPPATVAGGQAKSTLTLEVTLWAPGSYTTPALDLTYRNGDENRQSLSPVPLTVVITSVLTNAGGVGDTEKRELKAQAILPRSPLWPWLAAGGVGLLVVGGAGWWFWFYRLHDKEPVLPADLRSAQEIAHAELERIDALNLPAQGQWQRQYILVADCLRVYVEAITTIPARERTTSELTETLTQTELWPIVPKLTVFLEAADLVKFAGANASLEVVQMLPGDARQLIDEIEACFDSPTLGG